MFSSGTLKPAQFPFPTWEASIASCCFGILLAFTVLSLLTTATPTEYNRCTRANTEHRFRAAVQHSFEDLLFGALFLRLTWFHSSDRRRVWSWIPIKLGGDATHGHSTLNGGTLTLEIEVEVIEEGLVRPSLL